MLEKEYMVPSEMLWEIWSERLKKINADIKEFRITSIVVSTIIWAFVLSFGWFKFSNQMSSIVILTLGLAGVLWALCYLYTVFPYGHYFNETPMGSRPEGMDRDSYSMFLKDIERSTYLLSRRLHLLKKLITLAVIMTITSIFTLMIVTRFAN
jgi:hypothetical protein